MAAAGPGHGGAASNGDGVVGGGTSSNADGGVGGGTSSHGEEEDCIGSSVFRSLSPLSAVARRVLKSPTGIADG